jgi:hyaluronate lyase
MMIRRKTAAARVRLAARGLRRERNWARVAWMLAVCLLWGLCGALAQGDLERMRANVLEFHTGAGADAADSNVVAGRASIRSAASSALGSLRSDGSWPDVDYGSTSRTGSLVTSHFSRVRTMALAYVTPGQSLYHDDRLTSAVERALRFAQSYVFDGCPRPGNWWDWEIGLPNQLAPALVFFKDSLSSSTYQALRNTLRYLIYAAPHMTGENLIWSATNHLYLALLDGDAARMELVRQAFESQCVVQSGEGIKSDYSFHQHGAQLYNGGYGAGFAGDVARYVLFANGTAYQITRPALETFARYVVDGSAWMMFDNVYEPACRSRELTRGNTGRSTVLTALLVVATVPNPRQDEAAALAKRMMEIQSGYDLSRATMARAVLQSPIAARERVGHKHFWKSDLTVHRRSGWFISLKMFSNRVKAGENTNDEGKKSWHLSDGLTWILPDYSEYYTGDVLPTLDWDRLPGTTVERKPHAPGAGLGTGRMAFVGGAGVGERGVSAMQLDANDSELTALKSWFFFDDEMVCLGSSITCPTDNRVETIVNQRRLRATSAPLTVDGIAQPVAMPWSESLTSATWAQCEGLGYYFPGRPTVQAQRQVRQGSWYDLNSFRSTAVKSNPILTLWFDHGARPSGAKYAYAVLPGRTAAAMTSYATSLPITIVAHDDRVHAVRHRGLGALGAVFWKPGAVEGIEVDRPCVVYCERAGGVFTIGLSEPSHTTATIHVTIDEPLRPLNLPPNATSTVDARTTVLTFRVRDGENSVATLGPLSSSVRGRRY